ncbi:relaxase/mobilization nuclease domain-containing protein [Desulfonatronum parangueonense]
MSATISIRIGPVRSSDYSGQRTHDMRTGQKLNYVDYEKSHLNTGGDVPTVKTVHEMNEDQKHIARAEAQARLDAAIAGGLTTKEELAPYRAGVMACRQAYQRNGVVAYRGILTYGRDAQDILSEIPLEEADQMAKKAIRNAADVLETTAFGITAHRDESALHYHYYFLATNKHGKKLHPKKADCQRMQTDAAKAYKHLGIKRGKKIGDWIKEGKGEKTIHRSVQELHRDLPLEILEKEMQLKKIQEQIEEQKVSLEAQRITIEQQEHKRTALQAEMKAQRNALEILSRQAIDQAAVVADLEMRKVALDQATVQKFMEKENLDAQIKAQRSTMDRITAQVQQAGQKDYKTQLAAVATFADTLLERFVPDMTPEMIANALNYTIKAVQGQPAAKIREAVANNLFVVSESLPEVKARPDQRDSWKGPKQ